MKNPRICSLLRADKFLGSAGGAWFDGITRLALGLIVGEEDVTTERVVECIGV